MTIRKAISLTSLLLLPGASYAAAPWLPIPHQSSLNLSYVAQSADELYAGSAKGDLPDDLEQDTFALGIEYGLFDALSLFAELGYASSDFAPAGDNDEGIADSRFGVKWRVLDEFKSGGAPTVSLRGTWIVEGDYETGRLDAIGDGASGYELSVIVGKQFVPRVSAWAELGYRDRNNDVPSDVFYETTIAVTLVGGLSGSIGYLVTDSDGDLDIGAPDFSPDRFPEVEEDVDLLKLSLSYAFNPDLSIALNYGSVEDGRNTAISEAYGASLAYSF